ncbi:MAG: hypothetical protein WD873_02835, partial [Candidatus Hydrogenedentales bacterium]
MTPATWSAAVVAVLVVGALAMGYFWRRYTLNHDRAVLRKMEPLLDELYSPLRHLEDRRIVWPNLTDQQRQEIEEALVYRERFHEKQVEKYAGDIISLARSLRAFRYWRLRSEIVTFLKGWHKHQADELKVLIAMVR